MPFDVDEFCLNVQWMRQHVYRAKEDRECWLCERPIHAKTRYQYTPLRSDDYGAYNVHTHLACWALMSEWDEEQKRIYNRFEMGNAVLAMILAEARYEVDPRYVDWEDELDQTDQRT